VELTGEASQAEQLSSAVGLFGKDVVDDEMSKTGANTQMTDCLGITVMSLSARCLFVLLNGASTLYRLLLPKTYTSANNDNFQLQTFYLSEYSELKTTSAYF